MLSLGFTTNTASAYVSVDGYYRANGTYVAPHVRSEPNGLKYDNYGYTPSQGLYNDTYGTRGSTWDTPTYITDPNYYQGKSLYDSGNTTYSSPSYSGYGYSSTPTCPINSYADGTSCKCNYGYAVSGSSCVSQDSLCHDQLGYSSSFNSLNNTCKCNSGYVIGASGQCTSASSYCSAKIGLMSQYNSSTKTCECMIGYEYDGLSCKYKTTDYSNSYTPSYSSPSATCPINSHESVNDSNKCTCNSGYQPSQTKDSCTPIPTKTNDQACSETYGANSNWDGTKNANGMLNCGCVSGYSWNGTKTTCVSTPSCSDGYTLSTSNTCITYDQSCQSVNNFDSNIIGNKGTDGKLSCTCVSGYSWSGTQCIKNTVVSEEPRMTLVPPTKGTEAITKKKEVATLVSEKKTAVLATTTKRLTSSTATSTTKKIETNGTNTQKHWYEHLNPLSWFR